MALTNKLTNIADAIRNKTGKTELLTLDEMPVEIESIQGGGGEEPLFTERQDVSVSSSASSGFLSDKASDGYWDDDWRVSYYPVFLKTLKYVNLKPYNINKIAYTASEKLTDQLKDLVISGLSGDNAYRAFYGASYLTHAPVITGSIQQTCGMFQGCVRLKDVSGLANLKISSSYVYSTSAEYYKSSMFANCYALRNIPSTFLTEIGRYPVIGYQSTTAYGDRSAYYNTFRSCYSLDEIVDMGVFKGPKMSMSSNMFTEHVHYCARLKRYTFETNEDGTPIQLGGDNVDYPFVMLNQTLDFSTYVGYCSTGTAFTNLQSYGGFTTDTQVVDDATYQALKDNPDYWTTDINYARYNHDSAVETINSLPIYTSGKNTIKFKGAAGALTDGGAINTLTEEEIAVAAAKGWTVTLV